MLRYGSVCSGIESASVAWEPLGMSAAWFSEIEPFPCSVLAHHWPHVTNFGDMTQLPSLMRMGLMEAPDVLVGGTPCQAFSVAGKRDSLDDERGQLTLTYVDLLNAIDEQRVGNECIAVWENVPGVLNTKDNAFGCFLGELSGSGCELQPSGKRWGNAGCVFGPQRAVAWRVIDAQYFGVAQRRRRVFVVASARDGFDPTKILFESEGVRRDSAPSRKAREEVAGFTTSSFAQYSEGVGSLRASGGDLGGGSETLTVGTLDTECGYTSQTFQSVLAGHVQVGYRMVAFGEYADDDTASTMKARDYKDATDLCLSVHGTQDPCVSNNLAFALGRNGGAENAVFGIPGNWIGRKPENGGNAVEPMNNISPCQTVTDRHAVAYGFQPRIARNGRGDMGDLCSTLTSQAGQSGTGDAAPHVVTTGHVRRLTPVECERLQGFPDGHTDVPHNVKPAADGPRYKAIGNSKAVPCIQWIGARLITYQMGLL